MRRAVLLLITGVACFGASGVGVGATLNWTGSGTDPTDFTDLGNWDNAPSTPGVIDLANLVDDYVVNDGSAAIALPATTMNFAGAGSLSLISGTMTGLVTGLNNATLSVTGGSLQRQWIGSTSVTLGGTGQISLNGGNDPLPDVGPGNTLVNFTSTASALNMFNENVGDFVSEHLGKVTVNGAAAVIGSDPSVIEAGDNLLIVSDGGSGSIVSAVPEPSVLTLAGMGIFALGFYGWRRRRS